MHAPPLENETLAGRYRLAEKIGEGGMGAVYEALDQKTNQRVAVKILTVDDDEKLRARFEQEARATMELAHPNIVRVSDFRAAAGEPSFLVMELLQGESLRDRMKREKHMAIADAARIAMELCEALSAAHAAGVVHRDVKPPNVFLVGPNARVKLLDFGIAKVRAEFGKVHTTTGTVLGTPSYFAPEQLLAKEVDGRTDVHAVGIVLYEMLTARRPWMEEHPVDLTAAILHAAAPPIEKLRADVPPDLAKAIHEALAKDRIERPTAAELAKRLARFAPRRRSLAPFFVVALGLAVAAGAYQWTIHDKEVIVQIDASAPTSMAIDAEAPALPRDAAALFAQADDAHAHGNRDLERSLLMRALDDSGLPHAKLDYLAALCEGGVDDWCFERAVDSGARTRDGHLADADGGSGGRGAEVEVRPNGVDALP